MKLLTTIAILASAATVTVAMNSTPATVTGSATGRVVFDGEKPEAKPLSITEKQSEGCCPAGVAMDTTDRSLLIGKDGGLANVVVTVDVKGAKLEVPEEAVEIDQTKCRFEPHVMVVPVGTTLRFLNSDEVPHNVHTYATKVKTINKTIPPGSKEEQVMDKADRLNIKCDVHPWMESWVFISDTPYYAVTDENGNFEIKGLEPGTHKAEFWHEKLGRSKGEIKINADGTAEAVEVKMGEKKKSGGRRRR